MKNYVHHNSMLACHNLIILHSVKASNEFGFWLLKNGRGGGDASLSLIKSEGTKVIYLCCSQLVSLL